MLHGTTETSVLKAKLPKPPPERDSTVPFTSNMKQESIPHSHFHYGNVQRKAAAEKLCPCTERQPELPAMHRSIHSAEKYSFFRGFFSETGLFISCIHEIMQGFNNCSNTDKLNSGVSVLVQGRCDKSTTRFLPFSPLQNVLLHPD